MRKFAGLFLGVLLSLGLAGGLAGCGGGNGSGHFAPPPGGGGNTAEYLFASANGQVMAFSVDANTGALGTPVTATVSGMTDAGISVLADPAGKFLYVSDQDNDSVHVFSIASNGSLTQITGSPYTLGSGGAGSTAAGLAMDSAGKFLYAVDNTNNMVTTFSVSSSSGALTVVGSPVSTVGSGPLLMAADPSAQFVYTADNADTSGGISGFTINSTSGALTLIPGAPFDTTINANLAGLAIHPNGKFLYVAASAKNELFSETINNTGTLTTLGSPTPTGNTPAGVAMDPSGKYLYVANALDGTISGYSVDANSGALTAMSGSPFATTAAPILLTVDPSGKFLYATNPSDNVITGFTISSNGSLTQFSGAATAAGNQPLGLTVVAVPQ